MDEKGTGSNKEKQRGFMMDREMQEKKAIYLGVNNWGAAETKKERAAHFRYRFLVNGLEKHFTGSCENDYALQNALKVGYPYCVTISDGAVTAAWELEADAEEAYHPPVCGVRGERTVKNFLQTALEPVGTALYVFGGGWNWQDNGAAPQARALGVSPDWVRFFRNQDATYTYKDRDGKEENRDPKMSYYPFGDFNQYYYAGLDCSGYVGWAVYNALETESGRPGYVGGANGMAKRFSEMGLGTCTKDEPLNQALQPGDIVSMDGHVWISLGVCADGSGVILHSTPSMSRLGQPGGGVQIGAVAESEQSEAYRLADQYMTHYYPAWHKRYPTALKSPALYFALKLEESGRFSWNLETLADPEGITGMRPDQVLGLLFGKTQS